MVERVTPIIFVGPCATDPVEAMVDRARQAVTLDTLEKLLAIDLCAPPIVATADDAFAAQLERWPVIVEHDGGNFHFGRRLSEIIERRRIGVPLYLGAGSAPLLSQEAMRDVCVRLLANPESVLANNFFSADFVGFNPGSAIAAIALPTMDNDLAFQLQRQVGLKNLGLERTAATQMDVDTPTDLMVLRLHPGTGPRTRTFLEDLNLDLKPLRQAMRLITDPKAEVIVFGRVGTHVWAHLETDLACRKRVFSEERGMRASGREERGEVRSLVGMYLESVGPERFFTSIGELGQAAFVDSRVIFNHLGLSTTAADRFRSDLLWSDGIVEPMVRAITRAAQRSPIPVVLGGHSLVAGGLWALIEAAWLERDRERGITWPDQPPPPGSRHGGGLGVSPNIPLPEVATEGSPRGRRGEDPKPRMSPDSAPG